MLLIGLDDGHGKNTLGKMSPDGLKENEFNHFTKIELIIELKRLGFRVCDCSPSRGDESLAYRVNLANHFKCDAYVSIHFNAFGSGSWNKVRGLETFHHPDAPKTGGYNLARCVHKFLTRGTSMPDRGVKEANFYVLRKTKMAACLVECGFMTNKEDRILMASPSYRKECAKEIAQGLCEFFNIKYTEEKEDKENMNYKEILNLVSPWGGVYIKDIENMHRDNHNWKGIIPRIYYFERS